jgi:hypothetical protein
MRAKTNEQGFSYLDVMIGMLILLVGVMALAAAITGAVIRSRDGEMQLIAKQYATSTTEAIFSARDLDKLGWDAIGNEGTNPVNGVNQGIFVKGLQDLKPNAGTDGIVGTADDSGSFAAGTPEAKAQLQRKIVITDYDDPERTVAAGYPIMIRKIVVTISYVAGNTRREEELTTMITNYSPN